MEDQEDKVYEFDELASFRIYYPSSTLLLALPIYLVPDSNRQLPEKDRKEISITPFCA